MSNNSDSNSSGNGSDNSGGGGGGGGPSAGDVISGVALAVSLIALLSTLMQVLQQYYASAIGYSNCDEKVMGEWSKSKRRKFRWYELRFEVQFEAPVIFVCPPNNKSGPVKDAPIVILNGEKKSYEESRVLEPAEAKEADEKKRSQDQVHTADNERATWVTLLGELQGMELSSRKWEEEEFHKDFKPPQDGEKLVDAPAPARFEEHTLCVALQSKKRSWDTMPGMIRKPYATTTICHIVEIAAMLGIYWKEFDRSRNRYRAEGNGYVLIGDNQPDLGIMFSFQIAGKAKFAEYRLIPSDGIKELCFGYAATIFSKKEDHKRLELQNVELSGLEMLKLGTPHEIAETLTLAGCNTNTVNYFRSERKKVSHLFPVAFELLGMLGRTLQIQKSAFRMLPNPTCYHWDRRTFSMTKLIRAYRKNINNEDITKQTAHTRDLTDWSTLVFEELKRLNNAEADFSTGLLDALHKVINHCDAFLEQTPSDDKTEGTRQGKVILVLREHFQVVLGMINADGDESPGGRPPLGRTSISSPSGRRPSLSGPPASPLSTHSDQHSTSEAHLSFEALDAASPEEKQNQFMDIYFTIVLPNVIEQVIDLKRRRTTFTLNAGRGHGYGNGRPPHLSVDSTYSFNSSRSRTPSPVSVGPPTPIPFQEPAGTAQTSSAAPGSTSPSPGDGLRRRAPTVKIQVAETSRKEDGSGAGPKRRETMGLPAEEQVICDIWYTLVLRMLCWLLLHDFHKKDVQMPKSELVGSRLPVYIA